MPIALRDRRIVIVAILMLLLNACTVTSYHMQKKGVVAADFYADKVGSVLVLVNKSQPDKPVALIEITPLDNFRLLELPAGEYAWSEVRESGRVTPLGDRFDLSVKADCINYIGSMLIKSFQSGPHITVVNQATQVQKRLETQHQAIAKQLPFVVNLTRQRQ